MSGRVESFRGSSTVNRAGANKLRLSQIMAKSQQNPEGDPKLLDSLIGKTVQFEAGGVKVTANKFDGFDAEKKGRAYKLTVYNKGRKGQVKAGSDLVFDSPNQFFKYTVIGKNGKVEAAPQTNGRASVESMSAPMENKGVKVEADKITIKLNRGIYMAQSQEIYKALGQAGIKTGTNVKVSYRKGLEEAKEKEFEFKNISFPKEDIVDDFTGSWKQVIASLDIFDTQNPNPRFSIKSPKDGDDEITLTIEKSIDQ